MNGTNCGLFAIAYATSLAFKQDPTLQCGMLLTISFGAIKFTVERYSDDGLPFLDTLNKVLDDGTIDVSIYRKKTHTDHRYLHFSSHHPPQHKAAVVRTLVYRTNNLLSKDCHKDKERTHIGRALAANGYPRQFIHKFSQDRKIAEKKSDTEERKGFALLPYVQGNRPDPWIRDHRHSDQGSQTLASGTTDPCIRDHRPWIRDHRPLDQGSQTLGSEITDLWIRDHRPLDQGLQTLGSGSTDLWIRNHRPVDQGSQTLGSGTTDPRIRNHRPLDQGPQTLGSEDCFRNGSVIHLKSKVTGKTLSVQEGGVINGDGHVGFYAFPGQSRFYPGRVSKIDPTNFYAPRYYVNYDDGDQGWVNFDQVRLLPMKVDQ
ncbi:hypothetical protein QZH41_001147, partial [Actinostola sp. cb2023]